MESKLLKLGFKPFKDVVDCWYNEYDGFHLFIHKTKFQDTDKQKYYAIIEAFDGALVNIPNYVSFNWIKNFDDENNNW